MKTSIYYLAVMLLLGLYSCEVEQNYYYDENNTESYPAHILMDYEVWYLDYNNTTGRGEVPFMARAFTLSFIEGASGTLYANNNIAGIGFTGDGYGIDIGLYNIGYNTVDINHDIDGGFQFHIYYDGGNRIRMYNAAENVTYYLYGYNRDNFDYDQLYYDNIEYLLQEYTLWRKTYTANEGYVNDFDEENFLAFTPENTTTFYSSLDDYDTNFNWVQWDYTGAYHVEDINGYNDIKVLVLEYDEGFEEEFELSLTSDNEIYLYHYNSGSTYKFEGEMFIQYKNKLAQKRIKYNRIKRERPPHKTGLPIKQNKS